MTNKTQFAKLGLFDAKVPRYTSYPTAPHFNAEIGANTHATWIQDIPENAEVSLYIHVPFCRRLCWFCACRTQGTSSASPVAAYVETLKAELRMLAQHLPKGVTLSRLHWGGGTPTLLDPAMMADLCRAIFKVAPMAPTGEFSVEIDPNEIDKERLDVLSTFGMNRASIGVQDFDPDIQQAIGRSQTYEVTQKAVDMIRETGVQSLNADILFGLPGQTKEKIADSVQKLLSLSPDRVALYGYAHVPWMAKRQQLIPSEHLPTPQERLTLFEVAKELFDWDGFETIGIDHFARPTDGLAIAAKAGTLRRNFQGYTDDQATALIGVGASSISRFPKGYTQNAPATSAHITAIGKDSFSTSRGHVFTPLDQAHARMIEMVMCDFQIDSAEIIDRFGLPKDQLMRTLIDVNTQFQGLLNVDQKGLWIPPQARPLTRLIARAFDRYDLHNAGHSSAI